MASTNQARRTDGLGDWTINATRPLESKTGNGGVPGVALRMDPATLETDAVGRLTVKQALLDDLQVSAGTALASEKLPKGQALHVLFDNTTIKVNADGQLTSVAESQATFQTPLVQDENLHVVINIDDTLQINAEGELGRTRDEFELPLIFDPTTDTVFLETDDTLQVDDGRLGLSDVFELPLVMDEETRKVDLQLDAPLQVKEDGHLDIKLHASLKSNDDGELEVNSEQVLKTLGALNTGFLGDIAVDQALELGFEALSDLTDMVGDPDISLIRLMTTGDFSQKTGKLAIASQGNQRIHYSGVFDGINTDDQFTYNETLKKLVVNDVQLAPRTNYANDLAVPKQYLAQYIDAKPNSGVVVGAETANQRQISVNLDPKTLEIDPTNNIQVNAGVAATTGLVATDSGLSVARDALVDNATIKVDAQTSKLHVDVTPLVDQGVLLKVEEGTNVVRADFTQVVDGKSIVWDGTAEELAVNVGSAAQTSLVMTDAGLAVARDALVDNSTIVLNQNDKLSSGLTFGEGLTLEGANVNLSPTTEGAITYANGVIGEELTAGLGLSRTGNTLSLDLRAEPAGGLEINTVGDSVFIDDLLKFSGSVSRNLNQVYGKTVTAGMGITVLDTPLGYVVSTNAVRELDSEDEEDQTSRDEDVRNDQDARTVSKTGPIPTIIPPILPPVPGTIPVITPFGTAAAPTPGPGVWGVLYGVGDGQKKDETDPDNPTYTGNDVLLIWVDNEDQAHIDWDTPRSLDLEDVTTWRTTQGVNVDMLGVFLGKVLPAQFEQEFLDRGGPFQPKHVLLDMVSGLDTPADTTSFLITGKNDEGGQRVDSLTLTQVFNMFGLDQLDAQFALKQDAHPALADLAALTTDPAVQVNFVVAGQVTTVVTPGDPTADPPTEDVTTTRQTVSSMKAQDVFTMMGLQEVDDQISTIVNRINTIENATPDPNAPTMATMEDLQGSVNILTQNTQPRNILLSDIADAELTDTGMVFTSATFMDPIAQTQTMHLIPITSSDLRIQMGLGDDYASHGDIMELTVTTQDQGTAIDGLTTRVGANETAVATNRTNVTANTTALAGKQPLHANLTGLTAATPAIPSLTVNDNQGLRLNASNGALITKSFFPSSTGVYAVPGVGRCGLFMENNSLRLGLAAGTTRTIGFAGYNNDSTFIDLFNIDAQNGNAVLKGYLTLADGTLAAHAATRGYVDSKVAAVAAGTTTPSVTAGTNLVLTGNVMSLNPVLAGLTTAAFSRAVNDNTALITLTNSNAGTSAQPLFRILNDTLTGLNLFLNSSTKTTEGGVNVGTLRNDAGQMRIQSRGSKGMRINADTGSAWFDSDINTDANMDTTHGLILRNASTGIYASAAAVLTNGTGIARFIINGPNATSTLGGPNTTMVTSDVGNVRIISKGNLGMTIAANTGIVTFDSAVAGVSPTDPTHFATRQYVDGMISGGVAGDVTGSVNGVVTRTVTNTSTGASAQAAFVLANGTANTARFVLNGPSAGSAPGGTNSASLMNDAGDLDFYAKGHPAFSASGSDGSTTFYATQYFTNGPQLLRSNPDGYVMYYATNSAPANATGARVGLNLTHSSGTQGAMYVMQNGPGCSTEGPVNCGFVRNNGGQLKLQSRSAGGNYKGMTIEAETGNVILDGNLQINNQVFIKSTITSNSMLGDTNNNGTLFVGSNNGRVGMGYDDAQEIFIMQGVSPGIQKRAIALNPVQGGIILGAAGNQCSVRADLLCPVMRIGNTSVSSAGGNSLELNSYYSNMYFRVNNQNGTLNQTILQYDGHWSMGGAVHQAKPRIVALWNNWSPSGAHNASVGFTSYAGGTLLFHVSATGYSSFANVDCKIESTIDDVVVHTFPFFVNPSNTHQCWAYSFLATNIAAGAHTLKLRWQDPGFSMLIIDYNDHLNVTMQEF